MDGWMSPISQLLYCKRHSVLSFTRMIRRYIKRSRSRLVVAMLSIHHRSSSNSFSFRLTPFFLIGCTFNLTYLKDVTSSRRLARASSVSRIRTFTFSNLPRMISADLDLQHFCNSCICKRSKRSVSISRFDI